MNPSPDLLSLVLTLTPAEMPPQERNIPRWWGSAAHQLLLETMRREDPDLSQRLHAENEIRPFTASTLHGRFPDHTLDPREPYELRLTALTRPVAETLLGATIPAGEQGSRAGGMLAPGQVIELDRLPFRVQAAACSTDGHPMAGTAGYQDFAARYLLSARPAPEMVTLKFTSPTNFSSNGRLSSNGDHFPYPMPDLVFGSLLERWNACSPMAFPDELRLYAAKSLHINSFQLNSRKVKVAGGLQIGAVGLITFRTHNYDRYWMSLIDTLAHFAFYAGIGAKTAMGFGQSHQVEHPGDPDA